jgi:peptide deformylase
MIPERFQKLSLLSFNDPILREALPEFDFANPPEDPKVIKSVLLDAMYNWKGAGLSANQVGLPFRVFVFGMQENVEACFNPKIMGYSKETCVMPEGCLSLPGITLHLKRPIACVLSFQTETGETKVLEYKGFSSRVIQHEYDHMEGRNFTMLASPLKMQRAVDAWKKKRRNHG